MQWTYAPNYFITFYAEKNWFGTVKIMRTEAHINGTLILEFGQLRLPGVGNDIYVH